VAYLLVDHTEADGVGIGTADVRVMAQRVHESRPQFEDGRVAVAAPGAALYGLSRMWEMMSDSTFEFRVVRTRGDADRWLREQLREHRGVEIDLTF